MPFVSVSALFSQLMSIYIVVNVRDNGQMNNLRDFGLGFYGLIMGGILHLVALMFFFVFHTFPRRVYYVPIPTMLPEAE
jgi:hypothetical protein